MQWRNMLKYISNTEESSGSQAANLNNNNNNSSQKQLPQQTPSQNQINNVNSLGEREINIAFNMALMTV